MDKKLKQRLLGAAVLVALAVIIVPELVKEPGSQAIDSPENIEPGEEIVAAESASPTNYELNEPLSAPLPESQLPPPPPALPLAPMAETQETTGANVAEEVPEHETTSAEVPLDEPPPTESASVEPWVVTEVIPEPEPEPQPRVAASKPSSPPESAPSPPPRESVSTPKAEKPSIELPPLTLISKASLQAPSPQTSSSSNTAASAGGRRWVVQAGSFSQRQNADGFREQLQRRGFNAEVKQARVDERILYRVFVGPQGSRDESLGVRARLARDMGVEGSIVLLRR